VAAKVLPASPAACAARAPARPDAVPKIVPRGRGAGRRAGGPGPEARARTRAGELARAALAADVDRLVPIDSQLVWDPTATPCTMRASPFRRLRSHLRTFEWVFDPWARVLRERMRWLSDGLATARDADVLLDHVAEQAARLPSVDRRRADDRLGAAARAAFGRLRRPFAAAARSALSAADRRADRGSEGSAPERRRPPPRPARCRRPDASVCAGCANASAAPAGPRAIATCTAFESRRNTTALRRRGRRAGRRPPRNTLRRATSRNCSRSSASSTSGERLPRAARTARTPERAFLAGNSPLRAGRRGVPGANAGAARGSASPNENSGHPERSEAKSRDSDDRDRSSPRRRLGGR